MAAKSSIGLLFLNLDDGVYEPGSEITGVVNLRISKSCTLNKLSIILKGEEESSWVEKQTKQEVQGGKTKTVKFDKTMSRTIKLLDFKEILNQWPEGEKTKSGDHQWPFKIAIPQNLPSTLFWSHKKQNARAVVTYSVEA